MNKFLNIRIGVEFYNTLNTHQIFQKNYKAISPAFYFLQRIANHVDYNKGEPVEFSSVNISTIFNPYTKGSYRPYLVALVELGLLVIDESYYSPNTTTTQPPTILQYVTNKVDNQGFCKSYKVTELGIDLLNSSNLEYLKKLHKDKGVKRKNQKNISRRKVMKKTYKDYVLDYMYDGLINLEFDSEQAMAMVTGSNWSLPTQQSAYQSLITFTEKDFTELKPNDVDGRVFNEFVAMKSDLRKTFSYKSMVHSATIDIRSCHPTFFSSYILDCYYKQNNLPNPTTTTQPTNILQYVTNKVDNSGGIDQNQLLREHKRWVELFTNPTVSPRDVIAKECGYDNETCKSALNESINGSGRWKRLISWIETNYPQLFKVWSSTDVSKTGPSISRDYESKLMLNPQLYKYAEGMDIKIAYEYDGVSVFANENDTGLTDKLNFLSKYITFLSRNTWGIPVVMKIKTNK